MTWSAVRHNVCWEGFNLAADIMKYMTDDDDEEITRAVIIFISTNDILEFITQVEKQCTK